jgi:hypothetical protein
MESWGATPALSILKTVQCPSCSSKKPGLNMRVLGHVLNLMSRGDPSFSTVAFRGLAYFSGLWFLTCKIGKGYYWGLNSGPCTC